MIENSITPSELDDSFIRVFIEELATNISPSVSEADDIDDVALDPLEETQAAIPTVSLTEPVAEAEETQPAKLDRQPDPNAAAYRWQLRIAKSGEPECVLPLEDEPMTIGRRPKNSVVFKCDRTSRDHARIWLDKSGPRIKDLGSRNGTWVNGIKVPAAFLRANDIIKIGTISIHVEHAESDDGPVG